MRWLVRGVVALVALGVVVFLIGTRIPEGHRATVQGTVEAPPGAVWDAITAVEAFPTWRAGVDRVEVLEPRNGLPVWRERGSSGELTIQVVYFEPPQRMVARVTDAGGAFGGTWTYDLAPAEGGGTQVTLTEDGEIYNPIFRVVARFVTGYEATMEAYLEDLATHLGARGAP
jgi:uncharacterized protein YndB with AHSA1/START domain